MPSTPKFKPSALAICLLLPVLSVHAGRTPVVTPLQQLVERIERLEQHNRELTQQIQTLTNARIPATTQEPSARMQTLERQQSDLQQQVAALAPPASETVDEAPGLTVEGGLVAVAQAINGPGSTAGKRQTALNYRGDLLATLPAGHVGEARGTLVGHLRVGQGGGLGLRPTYTGTANSSTFEAGAGSEETYAVLAQAHYQLDWQLDDGQFNDQAGSRIELTIGKMDLFGFFDQNSVAGDEASGFMNNVFVHNPLLDSGGDIAADAYGFAPGVRSAWFHRTDDAQYGISMGVFGSGGGATLATSPGKPLVIAQVEYAPMQINGEPRGNYRLYAWRNGRTGNLLGEEQTHAGIGVSVDQRIGREWNLFGRYGKRFEGDATFNEALTLGFEHGGRLWGRGTDAAGLAVGWLNTSSSWRDLTANGTYVDADGMAYAPATGHELTAELYYRFKINESLTITPDYQYIQRAGGDSLAPDAHVFGVRASFGF